jgi:hypothetical protein
MFHSYQAKSQGMTCPASNRGKLIPPRSKGGCCIHTLKLAQSRAILRFAVRRMRGKETQFDEEQKPIAVHERHPEP